MVDAHRLVTLDRSGRRRQDPPARRGRPPPARGARPSGRSCCVSWPRRTRTRPSMPSPRRWRSTVAPVSGSPTGSPPCSPTPSSCCCSTTASTSSSRRRARRASARRRARTCTVVTTSRERLRVAGEQSCCHRCRRSRRPPTTRRPCSCSSSGPAPWRRASIPIRPSWRSSPRSCADSTGSRWPSSWPRPGCTRSTWPRWLPGSTAASRCCPPGIARRPATARWARRCRGRSGCSMPRLQRIFADLSVFAGSFTVADAAAICGTDAADAAGRARPARRALARACGRPTGATCCSRRSGRSAPSSSLPTAASTTQASATLATTSSGSRPPIGGCRSRGTHA